MVWTIIDRSLPGSDQYSKQDLQLILRTKRCLVVLDGLDEWSHPNKLCPGSNSIPHMKSYQTCTTITLTRPWKMCTIGLNSQQIDRHVEISSLDKSGIQKLGENALNILNKANKISNTHKEAKILHAFLERFHSTESEEIISIPYVLLQFICLWYDGREIGRSKCEIYSNITDFILKRGLKRTDLPEFVHSKSVMNTVPKCMINASACKSHMHLLIKVGMLAFYSLFSANTEPTLIIDTITISKYLNEKELEFFLKIGLLSQNKDSRCVSEERFIVSFHHKSIQDFFAALYISYTWKNEATEKVIRKSCASVSNILEFSSVLVFVCGINLDVFASLSLDLANDKVTQSYRKLEGSSGLVTLRLYQSMQMSCFRENERNGNDRIAINLQDIVVNISIMDNLATFMQTLGKFVESNMNNVKSLTVSLNNILPEVIEMLKIVKDFRSLESLFWCNKKDDFLVDILAGSAWTLKYIQITKSSISKPIIDSISRLSNMQYISLESHGNRDAGVKISHSSMKLLFDYLGKTTTLRRIRLEIVCMKNHASDCPGLPLDLSKLHMLQKLHLLNGGYPCMLGVNNEFLEECDLNARRFSVDATSSFLENLQTLAPALSSLRLHDIRHLPDILVNSIRPLKKLKILSLHDTDLGNNLLSFSPEIAGIEDLDLCKVTMCKSAWTELISGTFPTLLHLRCLSLEDIDIGDNILCLPLTMKTLENLNLVDVTMTSLGWDDLISKSFPVLQQLKRLSLEHINLSDNILSLDSLMTSLENVTLYEITMKTAGWVKLISSVCMLSQSVTVELRYCDGPLEDEWKTIESDFEDLPVNLMEPMKIHNLFRSASVKFQNIK